MVPHRHVGSAAAAALLRRQHRHEFFPPRARARPRSCAAWAGQSPSSRGGKRLNRLCTASRSRGSTRPRPASSGGTGLRRYGFTGTGFIPQISSAYCRIVRSLENFPMPAVLRIDFRVHPA
jgi:hypothetical protein